MNSTLAPSSRPSPAAGESEFIKVQQLSKSFGRTAALRSISIDVVEGETVALLGPNGAGKTTLLRILATLDKPSAGVLEIGGMDVLRHGLRIRAGIGMVAHQTYLHPELTVQEELRFYGRLYGVPSLDVRTAELLSWSGLAERRGFRVEALSRGQQQRLAIARALLHDPALLLLDEPDTGLDHEGREMLGRLFRERRRTVVFSSHDRAWATALADRTITLSNGRIDGN